MPLFQAIGGLFSANSRQLWRDALGFSIVLLTFAGWLLMYWATLGES